MTSNLESELAFLSIQQAARLLRRTEISPVDLVNAALSRIDRLNPSINAFLTVLADRAVARESFDVALLATEIKDAEEDIAAAADEAARDKLSRHLEQLKALQAALA